MWLVYYGMAVVAGVLLSLQTGANPQLGKALGDPFKATLFAFALGTITMLLFVQLSSWLQVRQQPLPMQFVVLVGCIVLTTTVVFVLYTKTHLPLPAHRELHTISLSMLIGSPVGLVYLSLLVITVPRHLTAGLWLTLSVFGLLLGGTFVVDYFGHSFFRTLRISPTPGSFVGIILTVAGVWCAKNF